MAKKSEQGTGWGSKVAHRWSRWRTRSRRSLELEGQALRAGISLLVEHGARARHPLFLPEQPFDRQLLALSPLFRRSRKLYVDRGGEFRAALVSSPRTLSASILLEPMIEYSPIERELVWTATDPAEKLESERLFALRSYSASLFHEQSHRLLWGLLPPSPRTRQGVRRFLNFAESLVVATDMALGDELGPDLAGIFYLAGVVYDPGTEIGALGLSRREYRNYLQAAAYATYLYLEHVDRFWVERAVPALYSLPGKLGRRAVARASHLDQRFIAITNPEWQDRHWQKAAKALGAARSRSPLELPEDPRDNRLAYLWAERWFDEIGL